MSQIIMSQAFAIGGGDDYEDRVVNRQIDLDNGKKLYITLVADGYGGEGNGSRAAQIAVDSTLNYIIDNRAKLARTSVISLITEAIDHAANEVNQFVWQNRPADIGTTLTVAAITEENVLYVANVGNSRVYYHSLEDPKSGLQQLTQDHTFTNKMFAGAVRERVQKKNQISSNKALTRMLGPRPQVDIDTGIYLEVDTYVRANQRGVGGLELKPGFSVMVCTDGLVEQKNGSDSQLVTDDEIIEVLSTEEGDSTARLLVSLANSREPEDNVSVSVIQMIDTRRQMLKRRQQTFTVGAIATVATILLGILLFVVLRQGRQVDAISQLATQQAGFSIFEQTAVAGTLTAIPTATPLPSPTPRPTLAPNEVGAIFQGTQRQFFIQEQTLSSVSDDTYLAINHTGEFEDANVFMTSGTTVTVNNVSADSVSLSLSEGGTIFFNSGRYRNGVEVRLDPDRRVFFRVASTMRIEYPRAGFISATCFSGTCEFTTEVTRNYALLEPGERIVIEGPELRVRRSTLNPEDAAEVARQLTLTGAGQQLLATCCSVYLPTPTPSPSPTRPVIPTFTPVATVDDDDYGAFSGRILPPFDGFTSEENTDTRAASVIFLAFIISTLTISSAALFLRRLRRRPVAHLRADSE